jgi:hypothetical protein
MNKDKKIDWTLLFETGNPEIDNLCRLYKKDRYKARVIFMNNGSDKYENYRLVKFNSDDGNYQIVLFRKKTGISKTNKMYSAEKKLMSISYIKKTNQYYLINNHIRKTIRLLTLDSIQPQTYGHNEFRGAIIRELSKTNSWIRFAQEHNILSNVSFGLVHSKKLYSLKKALKYTYRINSYPVTKMIHESRYQTQICQHIQHYIEWLDNIESLNMELIKSKYFHDALKMAKTLGKTLNCSWSERRLKEEHDKWAKTITDIVYTDGNRDMLVDDLFLKFAEFSGYRLLTETKHMALEGKKNNHCVATYITSVDNGVCGIYSIGDYTLELNKERKDNKIIIYLNQFNGYSNKSAPSNISDEVKLKVNKFNEQLPNQILSTSQPIYSVIGDNSEITIDEDLPF